MSTNIAINGMGRIGRMVLRIALHNENFNVVAINASYPPETIAHLINYDTTHGRYDKKVEPIEDGIRVDNHNIKLVSDRNPENLPWKDLNIDIVIEATGKFNHGDKAVGHIRAGAKKVLLTGPSKGGEVQMIVKGVNDDKLDVEKYDIFSNASCTTNCIGPVAKVLNDEFGIVEGLMTTIHAYTGDQMTQDGPHKKGDKRRARAAAQNIVPNSTGAAKAIGKVIPEIDGKLDGGAQRVPVATGSLTEVTVVLEKEVTVEDVNKAMKNAADESFGYTEDEIVSSDIVGMNFGSLFDATQTRVISVGDKQLVKVAAWYDNEMSYTSQLVRTLEYLAELTK